MVQVLGTDRTKCSLFITNSILVIVWLPSIPLGGREISYMATQEQNQALLNSNTADVCADEDGDTTRTYQLSIAVGCRMSGTQSAPIQLSQQIFLSSRKSFAWSAISFFMPIQDDLARYYILSTCPLHTNSGCGEREAHIDWSMGT